MATLKELTNEEYFYPGHAACSGCGAVVAIRLAQKALGPRTVFVVPACCTSVLQSAFPFTAFANPCLNIAFEAAAAAASGRPVRTIEYNHHQHNLATRRESRDTSDFEEARSKTPALQCRSR